MAFRQREQWQLTNFKNGTSATYSTAPQRQLPRTVVGIMPHLLGLDHIEFADLLSHGDLGFERKSTAEQKASRAGVLWSDQCDDPTDVPPCSHRIPMISSSVNLDRFIRPSLHWVGL